VLGDGEVNLETPEQDKANSERAPLGATEVRARQAREKVAVEREFQRVKSGYT
jgi:hypothetical protein